MPELLIAHSLEASIEKGAPDNPDFLFLWKLLLKRVRGEIMRVLEYLYIFATSWYRAS